MHRVDGTGNVSGSFTEGNPGIGQPATKITADIMNALQEELVGCVLEKPGAVLTKADNAQVIGALVALLGGDPGGRLTLTTGVPVTTSDVSSSATLYYTPHRHNRIVLYNGTRWKGYTFSELSQTAADTTKSPGALSGFASHDVFVWDDAGTLRVSRGPVWAGETSRGTGAGTSELELFEGRWVNKVAITNGPAARRGLYVGTVRHNGAAAFCDTASRRFVWNAYNRVSRPMRALEATPSWSYQGAPRQANGSTANQLAFVQGLVDDPVEADVLSVVGQATTGTTVSVGIGVDSTSTRSSIAPAGGTSLQAGGVDHVRSQFRGSMSAPGYHFLAWLEEASVGGTTSWIGLQGGGTYSSGITGQILG